VRRLWPLLLVLSAACQTESRRLLVLDLTLSDPLTLETTAAPWHAAGYRVEYRRFYPHLTRLDLVRYRTVLVLGGREPESPSDALTVGDLAILNEWVRRDAVVVLGYTDGDGGLDRWVMNQWLAAAGAGIAVGTQSFESPATPMPHSALDNAGFEPFPAGRNRILTVRDRSQTLARAGGSALVAASRAGGGGLILVASRSLLSSIDADARTRDFLVALARWTRRPAEWATVGAAVHPVPLHLANAPQPVAIHPPQLAPPTGSSPTVLPDLPTRPASTASGIVAPSWIARQGMRVLWSRFALYSLDSLLGFVDVAALNALATKIPEAALADTLSTRSLWKVTGDRLQATSVHWFPAVSLVALPAAVGPAPISTRRLLTPAAPNVGSSDELNRHGELMPIPCGLDSLYWRNALRPTYRVLSHLGGPRPAPDVLTGVALDLDSAMAMYQGSGFCDSDYRVGLTAMSLDSAELHRLLALPPPLRYDTLLERGWLSAYYTALEAAVAERALALGVEMKRMRPDLRFAFRATAAPADWFSLGLLRGLSSPDAPVLLWLRDIPTRDPRTLLSRYQARGISALSALGLDPERESFAPAQLPRLRFAIFSEHAGFWLSGAATDSLGRVMRRLTK